MDGAKTSIVLEQKDIEVLLRQALGDPAAQAGAWELQRLTGGLEFTSSIYRLKGQAQSGGSARPWSAILKAIQPEANSNDPQGYRYWKREALAYQSALFQGLSGPVTAPRCYSIRENPDGSVWMWLEDVRDEMSHPWTLDTYARAARLLGQFNGASLAGRPLPEQAWPCEHWLHKYLEHAAPMVQFVRQNPKDPVVRGLLPGSTLPLTLAMWEERGAILKALDALPQTFCHQDAFERNLFLRSGQLVAIDWGYAGLAPVGAELAPLIGVAFGLGGFPTAQAKELDRACFTSYLEGLGQAGWTPNPRQVRMGYTFTVLLRYVMGATVGELLPGLLNDKTRGHWVEGMGVTPEQVDKTDAGIAGYYQAIAQEALKLLGPVRLARIFLRMMVTTVRIG